ncbi:MAG: hypothetical protein A2107_02635 [Verrucomicrobia bacterium GWF2_62_7]|nr:MAG: hypothetical protein A2107_02635 [Verrucomicrobia bacterium GWF2_62_7]
MIAAEPTTHIRLDKRGVAWVDDTKVKVIEVILDHLAYGHSADEIHLQHPHLSLAQVHAALAYYYDHQAELEAELEQRRRGVAALQQKAGASFSRKTLNARLKRA